MSLKADIALIRSTAGEDLLDKFYGLGHLDRAGAEVPETVKCKQCTKKTALAVQAYKADDSRTYYETVSVDSGEGVTNAKET